jgi:FAD/FMN-containing dehydrogenase
MPKEILTSWGRILRVEHDVASLANRFDSLPNYANDSLTFLPYGNGRSYGDSCLNVGGVSLKTRALDRFISFDQGTGRLCCESGVLLSEILCLIVSKGWFLPVTPGTRFITVGGAIANDVHGKNHHLNGTFGSHVAQFELLRSDGQRLICSNTENADYFSATIGGLGLTGLITWVEIQLHRIGNPWIDVETIRYESLDEFFDLCEESDRNYEYTASWIDCASKGKRLGRGLFIRGNHTPAGAVLGKYSPKTITFPFIPPVSMVNSLTLKAFNTAYYHKQLQKKSRHIQYYEPFFYPLDGILEWNRMYGSNGFYQYQCVIPKQRGKEAISDLLKEIAKSGMGSFLAVLKVCGNIQSPGMLSFPLPGVSLALDFPNRGGVHQLFSRLDSIVNSAGGRLYPAKDGRMPGELFRNGYPLWQEFTNYIDPRFSSSFWRRVMESK